jgi:peptidoglycan/LPS O-acetylase OafA/YrhL
LEILKQFVKMKSLTELIRGQSRDSLSSEPNRLDFLDGIRGVAAFWVVFGHCMIWGGWYGIPLPNPKVAVDIFMVVSGYLMFHLAEERARHEPPWQFATAIKFWARRFFRIAPVYYLALVTSFLLSETLERGMLSLQYATLKRWLGSIYFPWHFNYSISSFFMHVSFLFGLSPEYSASVGLPDWSIGLEMQFYALFPLLWMAFCGLRPVAATLLIGSGWLLCNSLFTYPHFLEPSFLPLKLDIFVIGMLAASANRDFKNRPLDAAVQFVMAMVIAWNHSIYVLAVAAIMCLMVSATNKSEFMLLQALRIISPILGNRLTRFMSEMSYGVYLTHMFIVIIFGGWLYSQSRVLALRPVFRTMILTAVTLPCSYALAWVVNRYVERPGIELGRRFIARMSKIPIKAANNLTLAENKVVG